MPQKPYKTPTCYNYKTKESQELFVEELNTILVRSAYTVINNDFIVLEIFLSRHHLDMVNR